MIVAPLEAPLDVAAISDVGTERSQNEDACAFQRGPGPVLVAVADGVAKAAAGEVASRMAVEITLRAFAEQPPVIDAGKRLYRAAQHANIEIHDRALVVPELSGMATTLTAIAIDGGDLFAAHVGDCRLYRLRGGAIVQLSKDHTLVGEKQRLGMLSEERARQHPDRSTLTRSLGRELIVAVDRITTDVQAGDVCLICSDGLYNVLEEPELLALIGDRAADEACHALIAAANARGTDDNLTAAVVRVRGAVPPPSRRLGLGTRLRRLLAT